MKINDLFVPFEDELQLLPSPRVPDPPLIEWKSAFGDLFFRLKGAEPGILWCDLGRNLAPKRMTRTWNGCRYFRVVPFEDGEDWALLRPKFALVKSPKQQNSAFWKWEAQFREGMTHRKWLEKPQEQLRATSADSSLQMARDCAALDESSRHWTIDTRTRFVAQTDKWEQLVRAALAISTFKLELPLNLLLLHPHSVEGPLDFDCVDSQLRRRGMHFWSPLPSNSKTLLRIVQRHIALPFWRGLDAQGARPQLPFYRFSIDSVSQHERLEAALVWRDFAHEIGKTDEIEPLLRELMG